MAPGGFRIVELAAFVPVNDAGVIAAGSGQPDLIVERLEVTASGVTVVIKNAGQGAVEDAFWVDVYLDPVTPPGYNQPWQAIAGQGLVWGVTQPIPAAATVPSAGAVSVDKVLPRR